MVQESARNANCQNKRGCHLHQILRAFARILFQSRALSIFNFALFASTQKQKGGDRFGFMTLTAFLRDTIGSARSS